MRGLLKTSLFFFLLLLLVSLITACGKEIPDAVKWPIHDFSYINQDGEAFTNQDLKGKITVADFIYTTCPTVCIPMTAHMEKLQEMAKKENLDVQFVSFSVDPTVDTGEVLKEYGKKFRVDFANWDFLTGYTEEEIASFAKSNFKALVQKASNDIIHGTRFYLIDQNGNVVKDYPGNIDTPYEEILKHIKILDENHE